MPGSNRSRKELRESGWPARSWPQTVTGESGKVRSDRCWVRPPSRKRKCTRTSAPPRLGLAQAPERLRRQPGRHAEDHDQMEPHAGRLTSRMRSRVRSRSASAIADQMVKTSLESPFAVTSPPRSIMWRLTPLPLTRTSSALRADRNTRSSLGVMTMSPTRSSLSNFAPPCRRLAAAGATSLRRAVRRGASTRNAGSPRSGPHPACDVRDGDVACFGDRLRARDAIDLDRLRHDPLMNRPSAVWRMRRARPRRRGSERLSLTSSAPP
jgi:hypothetical protein